MAKCLVTGGAGFIGSNLVDALIDDGNEVIVIDNLSTGKRLFVNDKAEFVYRDLRKFDEIALLFRDVDYVFHQAAMARVQPSIEDPAPYHDNNVNATFNVLLAAKNAKVKHVVYASSSSVYGGSKKALTEDMTANPMSPYALQKYIGEEYCRLFSKVYGLSTVCLRYFNVYGPRMSVKSGYTGVLSTFKGQLDRGEPMTICGDGTHTRSYTYVGDVVKANIAAVSMTISGYPINVGNSTEYSVNQIADMFGGERIHVAERIEPVRGLCSNKLAKEVLNWKPTMDLPEWIPTYK